MKDKERENGGLTDENGATDKSAVTDSSDKDAKGNRLDKKKLFYLFSTVGLSAFFCAFLITEDTTLHIRMRYARMQTCLRRWTL